MLYNLFENRDFVSVFAVALLAEGVDRNDSRGGGVTGLVGCPLEGDKDKPVGDYHKVESSKESAHIHSLKTFSIESGLLTVYNALKTGESVYLLRFNDGKSYYALERAIV